MATPLARKLQIKPGQRLRVVNAPADLRGAMAGGLSDNPVVTRGRSEAVLLCVTSLAEAEALGPATLGTVGPDGLAWVAYPKGTSGVATDVNRDRLRALLAPAGWQPVRQIALDDVWSAMRFRPADKVGS